MLVPASQSYWPIPRPSNGDIKYHRACLKCGELTECHIISGADNTYKKCIGCTFELCDKQGYCEAFVQYSTNFLDWVESFRHP